MLPVIILVGLRMGVFTPTEAGVVAAVYALFVSTVIYRGLKLSQLYRHLQGRGQNHRSGDVPGGRGHGLAWLITVADLPARWWACSSRSWAARSC